MRYLQQRAIPESLSQSLVASGQLYADSRANAVFLLHDKENQPVGAELGGTGPLCSGQRFTLGWTCANERPVHHGIFELSGRTSNRTGNVHKNDAGLAEIRAAP